MKQTNFKSKFEARVAQGLGLGEAEYGYETETFPYILEKNYTPDFPVLRPDGTTIYIEAKGKFDLEARQKMLAVKEQHPDKEFVLLFMRNNRLHSNSNTYYSDWAEKHGFDYAVSAIPIRWLLGAMTPEDKKDAVINVSD
jgi:hypothetical protein